MTYYAGINPYGLRTKSESDHVQAFETAEERDAVVAAADLENEALTREEAVEQFGELMVRKAEYLLEHGMPQGLGGLGYLCGPEWSEMQTGYEVRAGFDPDVCSECLACATLEEAEEEFAKASEHIKLKWFAQANSGHAPELVPNDYVVTLVEVELDEDGEFVGDVADLNDARYGIDQAIDEYIERDKVPFGMSHRAMKELGW